MSNAHRSWVQYLIAFLVISSCISVGFASGNREIWILRVDDTINPVISDYIEGIVSNASRERVACIIVELDTLGGVLESTHSIVQTLLNSTVPIVVYVSPRGARAASAGVFITLSGHIAAMSPATNIGAAHPVSIGPSAPNTERPDSNAPDASPDTSSSTTGDSTLDQKIINDTLAWARTIASNRDRNIEWIESAVRDSVSATEKEALNLGIIDVVAENRMDLIQAIDGRTVRMPDGDITLELSDAGIVEKLMPLPQRFLSAVINPTIAIYLLAAGILGLYIEITHPGLIFPGVVGTISLILALFAMHTLPINFAGLILILLAIGLFVAEVKVQSFGLLTVGGIVSFVFGASMLVDYELTGLKVSFAAIIPLAVAIAGITFFLVGLVIRTHAVRAGTGIDGMIGLTGQVKNRLTPEGTVFIHGEIWRARVLDGTSIESGRQVEVVQVEGLTLVVKPLDVIV